MGMKDEDKITIARVFVAYFVLGFGIVMCVTGILVGLMYAAGM